MKSIFSKVVMNIALMIFYISLSGIIWILISLYYSDFSKFNKIKASLIIIVETFLPSIVNLNLQSINCIEIDLNKFFVKADSMINCDSNEFIEWVLNFLKIYLKKKKFKREIIKLIQFFWFSVL